MIIHLDELAALRARARAAHLRRARPCAGQPALAGAGQGHARLRAAHRGSQGHGFGDEHASVRRHSLRIRAGRATSFPISPRTNRAGCSAAPKVRCTRMRTIATSRSTRETGRAYGRPPVRAPSLPHDASRTHLPTPTPPHDGRRRRRRVAVDCNRPRAHAAVRRLDVADRWLCLFRWARIRNTAACRHRCGHAARVRAHRDRAGERAAMASRSFAPTARLARATSTSSSRIDKHAFTHASSRARRGRCPCAWARS